MQINNRLNQSFYLIFWVSFLVTACSKETTPTLYKQRFPQQTNIDFANHLQENEAFNIVEYLYYYNGGGVAVGDINNDGLPDIYFTGNQVLNKLYLNKGNFQFEDITVQAGVAGKGDWKTGVSMADVNGDGWLDIYVCQLGNYKSIKGRNELFINNQDGTFSEQAVEYGLAFQGFSTQAAFFDYDKDGDLDCFLLNHSVHAPENYGDTTMRRIRDERTGDRLYRNDDGKFIEVTQTAGIISSKIGYGLGVVVGDIDQNSYPDIYVANDFHENDYLYYNNGDGTFTEAITASMGHTSNFSMGCDMADINNDGLLDIMSLDMKPEDETAVKNSVGADPYNIYRYKLKFGYHYQFPKNALQLNQGNLFDSTMQFSEIAQLAGVEATDWSWSVLLHDMDNDGWKDIFITNGIWRRPNDLDYLKFSSNQQIQASATNLALAQEMPSGVVGNYAFQNNKKLTFQSTAKAWGLQEIVCANGAAYADLDGDGDLDLIINNLNAVASIYENQSSHNYVQLALKGEGKNTFGIGAKAFLYAGGQMQVQEMQPVRGFQSSVEPIVHFGLGSSTNIDSLIVVWQSGKRQKWTQLIANQRLVAKEQEAMPTTKPALRRNKINHWQRMDFKHQENSYNDFDQEKLLLQQYSTAGPKIAVGDINGDGLEDFYIGGARGQAGQLFLQTQDSRFQAQIDATMEADANFEDTYALFFDADGDGDLDLYVVSGGGESDLPASFFQDRLYLNDGKGKFIRTALPDFIANGSCAVALDVDKDGDLDLFVGTSHELGKYGKIPNSYWLVNQGNAQFKVEIIPNLGKVKAAALYNQQIAIVGDWMPITFLNYPDQTTTVPNSSGWWNTIKVIDFQQDKKQSIFVGNRGENSDLRASLQEPVQLHVSDFDEDGVLDPIITYFKQGKHYTFSGKDELASQIVSLKKQFNDYSSFAQSTFKEVFPTSSSKNVVVHEVQTFASVVVTQAENNKFTIQPLPTMAQIAPIYAVATYDVDGDGKEEVFVAGNFYDNQPSLGRFDASFGVLLKRQSQQFSVISSLQHNMALEGQVRDLQTIRLANGRTLLLAARNNDYLIGLELEQYATSH
jgi:hypothetical protein